MRQHNAQELKESLTIDDIKSLLAELGADEPHHNETKGELITNTICHNSSSGSHKLYYSDSLKSFKCFTKCSCSMDVYEIVRKVYSLKNIELHFSDLIKWVATKTGKSGGFGFGSDFLIADKPKENEELEWMSRFTRRKIETPEMRTFSDGILDVFSPHMSHPEFTLDGISSEAMDRFEIKYYNKENALILPHRSHENGRILGLMARNLNEYAIQNGAKYIPARVQDVLYNHIKSLNLYGLHENKSNISRLKKVAVFEAEKSVLQVESMYGREHNFSIALSGKNISQYQVDLLLALNIEEIIFCYDKEFEHHEDSNAQRMTQLILDRGRKFAPYIRTFTVFDTEGLLNKNESPSDRGKSTLESLMRGKQEILNKE